MEKEISCLKEKEWNEKEKLMINNLIENLNYYKRVIPKSFRNDICEALQMCNELKNELDDYRNYFKKKGLMFDINKNVVEIANYNADDKDVTNDITNETSEEKDVTNDITNETSEEKVL